MLGENLDDRSRRNIGEHQSNTLEQQPGEEIEMNVFSGSRVSEAIAPSADNNMAALGASISQNNLVEISVDFEEPQRLNNVRPCCLLPNYEQSFAEGPPEDYYANSSINYNLTQQINNGLAKNISFFLKFIFTWESLFLILGLEIYFFSFNILISFVYVNFLAVISITGSLRHIFNKKKHIYICCSLSIGLVTLLNITIFSVLYENQVVNSLYNPFIWFDVVFNLIVFLINIYFILFNDESMNITEIRHIYKKALGLFYFILLIFFIMANLFYSYFKMLFFGLLDIQNIIANILFYVKYEKIREKSKAERIYLLILYCSLILISISAKLFLGIKNIDILKLIFQKIG